MSAKIYLCYKALIYGFPSSHVQRWELDHKEGWAQKNWRFRSVMMQTTLEGLLDSKEIKRVSPQGNQPWVFTGRTAPEAETPILLLRYLKSWLIGKDPDARKDRGQEEKGVTEDEMVGWHRQFNGHEFEQTPGAGDGQGGLACCCSWGTKVGHDLVTELNWTSNLPS